MDEPQEPSLEEMIGRILNQFKGEIKPMIEQKAHDIAGMMMGNICFYLGEHAPEISCYHSGMVCIASAEVLKKSLKENKTTDNMVKMFEAYLAQLGMSIKTGNK